MIFKRELVLANILTLAFFILDRFFKKLALRGMTGKVFFIEFSEYQNPSIALSISLRGPILYILIAIVLYFVIFGLIKAYGSRDAGKILAFSMILVGAFSNILDRIEHGAVIDYLNLPCLGALNIADIMILAGVIILLTRMVLPRKI